jgi:hypothetical protein
MDVPVGPTTAAADGNPNHVGANVIAYPVDMTAKTLEHVMAVGASLTHKASAADLPDTVGDNNPVGVDTVGNKITRTVAGDGFLVGVVGELVGTVGELVGTVGDLVGVVGELVGTVGELVVGDLVGTEVGVVGELVGPVGALVKMAA